MADEINVIINALLKDKQFKKTIKTMATDMNKGSKKIKKDWTSVVTGFNQGVELVKKLWRGLKSVMDLGREFAEYRQGMDALARNTGRNADKIVKKLKEVSKGTVSNKDVMLAANRLVALNVTKDTDKMAELFEVARLKAKAMGITTAQAVNDIATGIGRQSPLILDNLGIITKGWDKEARAAGKAMDQQFILNKILAEGREELKKSGAGVKTSAEGYQSMEAAIADLRIAAGRFVDRGLKPLIGWITKAIQALNKFLNALSDLGVEAEINEVVTEKMIKALKGFGIETEKDLKKLKRFVKAFDELQITNAINFDRIRELKEETAGLFKEITGKASKSAVDLIQLAGAYKQVEEAGVKAADEIRKKFEGSDGEGGGIPPDPGKTKKRAEESKVTLEEFYTFIDDQRQLDLVKEAEAFEKANLFLKQQLIDREISWLTFNERMRLISEKHQKNLVKINKESAGIIEKSWNSASSSMATDYSNGISQMIVSGEIFKKSFGDFIKELLQLFTQLIIKALIFKGIMAATGGVGGLFFNKGGRVPQVAYASGGMRARGTDTQPAMLTPGERVLTVDENKAFEQLLKSISIPTNVGTNNVNNSTTNEGDTFVQNTFNNEFGNESVDSMLDFSQRVGSNMLRR